MSVRAEHLLLVFSGYVIFLNVVSSWCIRLTFQEAIEALRRGQRSNLSLWSMVRILIIPLSLPLFVIGMLSIR